ncbi:MAG: hypothetical protein MJ247_07970 [Alphaproteobacteria bacterium]|nr:hypothetical protein [Alphaproteobacteria bacterium]
MKNILFCLMAVSCLSSCVSNQEKDVKVIIPGSDKPIVLQHTITREIVYCDGTDVNKMDICATDFERDGFVRLTDKPNFRAKDDLPRPGSYPTRRFRDNQNTPRW